jgi:hypothetical protein
LHGHERQILGRHDRPDWHPDVGERYRDPLPAARRVLVEALGHVFGQAKLAGGSSGRDGTIDERKLQPPGQRAAHLIAVRTIGR